METRGAGIVTAIPRRDAAKGGRTRMRQIAIVVHRYVGLLMAVFLIVAGLTGSLLVFYEELDFALNRELMEVPPPRPGTPMLDPLELAERVAKALPSGQGERHVSFEQEPEKAVSVWTETAPDRWQEVFVDPYTAAILGSREWGNLAEGTTNLMPFVYRLHYSLALGTVGTVLFGIIALLWTIDCFVGAYLTFPAPVRTRGGAAPTKSWFARWGSAWALRTNKLFSFVFTWHRASGLWVWAMLFVFAWSAVGLNLHEVYAPVMKVLTGMPEGMHDRLHELEPPYPEPGMTLREAHLVGRRWMEAQAAEHGFVVAREASLTYAADHGVFVYRVASDLDISEHPGTEVYFDGKDGRFLGFEAPSGIHAGQTITSWLYALHFAAVFGLGYRLFVVVMGIAIAALSVTGVWIWWRKRKKRALRVPARPHRAKADRSTPSAMAADPPAMEPATLREKA